MLRDLDPIKLSQIIGSSEKRALKALGFAQNAVSDEGETSSLLASSEMSMFSSGKSTLDKQIFDAAKEGKHDELLGLCQLAGHPVIDAYKDKVIQCTNTISNTHNCLLANSRKYNTKQTHRVRAVFIASRTATMP